MTAARLSWIILPGLGETPEEFAALTALLPPQVKVRIVDPWQTPVTSPPSALLDGAAGPVGVVGHSIGGLDRAAVERLVLVDTSLPSETGLRWFYPGRLGDRAVSSMLSGLGRLGLPLLVGPSLRRFVVRLGSASDRDLLPKATARARYGTAYSWLLFWRELTASWVLADEVGRLASGTAELPPTVMLVATGGTSRFTARRWLTAQRRLASRLGAEVRVLPDSAHLVHLDRPDAIATALTDSATTQRR
jgi:pimeloyl-ACP methyl ester carboxylesterase